MRLNSLMAVAFTTAAFLGTLVSMVRLRGGANPEEWLSILPYALTFASIWVARRSKPATEVCMVFAGVMATLGIADLVLPVTPADSFLEPAFRQSSVWFADMAAAALLFGGVIAYRWTGRPVRRPTSVALSRAAQ